MKILILKITFSFCMIFICASAYSQEKIPLTSEESGWMAKASRTDMNGWMHIKIKGEPFERGFQYGYLTALDYAAAIRTYKAMTVQTMGMDYSFFVQSAARIHKPRIPQEYLDEMSGIAAGFTKGGVPTTLDEVIGYNAYMEMTGYWWPTVMSIYADSGPSGQFAKAHCSGFIATGSATKDGKIVIGHTSFTEFWNGQYFNAIVEVTPTSGNKFVMQTAPGWIASMTDFWVTGGGIVVLETTIVGFMGYDTTKVPEYVRARKASQYANSIDEWVELMDAKNNGGYANMWLIGDIKTGEIADYEQGLIYTSLKKKTDGYFFGCNAPNDPQIRNLECVDVGYNDIRQQTGARRMRWPQVLDGFYGQIDEKVGQTMLADTYDVYLMKENNPCSRTICSHYDVDPMFYVSDPNAVWNIPYYPAGSVEGKVTTTDLAQNLDMWGIFGRADGVAFDADQFLKDHPQWNWQAGYLISRPSQPWTIFNGSK